VRRARRGRARAAGWVGLGLAACLALARPLAAADAAGAAVSAGSAGARTGAPEALWREARAAERAAFVESEDDPATARDDYHRAIRAFEQLARQGDGGGEPWWRSARCHWFLGELAEDEDAKLAHYEDAEDRAARGLAVDPDCAGCMLWKFTALGRIVTKRGLLSGLRAAPEMATLLARGIALHPTDRDTPNNSLLGNLHYGSALFYRVLPDWRWLGWLIGVRGDKERALEHARQAVALHPARIDFQVELGSQLLCLGTTREQPARLDEGLRVLARTVALETHSRRLAGRR
jgi:tetratricopeptide (TPR) repeat protein